MAVLRELRRQGRQITMSLLGVTVIGYFAFHAVEGERGLRAYFELTHRTAQARDALADLSTRRGTIERRVSLLKTDGLDLDLLEERAQDVLGLVHEDDVVILLDGRVR